MRSKGAIASWNDEKGFGFIKPSAGGKQVFIHISALGSRSRRPETGQLVTYTLAADSQGRARAVDAVLAGECVRLNRMRNGGTLALVGATIFLLVVGISVVTSRTPPLILFIYVIASLATFLIYWGDKSAARRGEWRTKERTLHLLSLLGGWPGALVAQQALRHKSRKQSFRIVFWTTVLLNCAGLIWLHTQSGSAAYARWVEVLHLATR